jgi:hypothetical protein
MKTECYRLIEEREGRSTRFADGPVGQEWSVDVNLEDQPMGRKKVVIMEIRQKESMVEVGQYTIDDGSKSQF